MDSRSTTTDRTSSVDEAAATVALDGAPDAAPRPPAWRKAAPLVLRKSADVQTVTAAVFAGCWQHWRANEAPALDGRDPEGVHQLRVGLRRAKSAATLFKSALTPERFNWITGEASWALSTVADARDWDVFIAELLQPVRLALPDDTALATLETAAGVARAAGYETARRGLKSDRYAQFCADFEAFLAAGSLAKPPRGGKRALRPMAAELLAARHRRAMKRGANLATLSRPQRHRVRIALKKLRYAVEFFGSLYPTARTARYKRTLKRMQDDLGHLNDIAVAERLLASLPAPPRDRKALYTASGLVRGWYARSLVQVEPAILEDWRRLRETKPFWQ